LIETSFIIPGNWPIDIIIKEDSFDHLPHVVSTISSSFLEIFVLESSDVLFVSLFPFQPLVPHLSLPAIPHRLHLILNDWSDFLTSRTSTLQHPTAPYSMATAEVAVQPAEATDVETRPYHSIISPDRKRKQQTPEGLNRGRGKMSRSDEYDSPSPPLDPELDQVYPSAHSSTSASGTAGESNASSRGGAGEETLTLRRREANRLAAQRFRSRKKGYQDSLEERIKILEDEKDIIARRLAQTRHQPTTDEGYYRQTETYRRRSPTPERAGDGDVRMASLESANRRLQDELRGVVEDNDRLRDEVERWRKWEREQREPRREEVSHAWWTWGSRDSTPAVFLPCHL
jgi:hypothetical protein